MILCITGAVSEIHSRSVIGKISLPINSSCIVWEHARNTNAHSYFSGEEPRQSSSTFSSSNTSENRGAFREEYKVADLVEMMTHSDDTLWISPPKKSKDKREKARKEEEKEESLNNRSFKPFKPDPSRQCRTFFVKRSEYADFPQAKSDSSTESETNEESDQQFDSNAEADDEELINNDVFNKRKYLKKSKGGVANRVRTEISNTMWEEGPPELFDEKLSKNVQNIMVMHVTRANFFNHKVNEQREAMKAQQGEIIKQLRISNSRLRRLLKEQEDEIESKINQYNEYVDQITKASNEYAREVREDERRLTEAIRQGKVRYLNGGLSTSNDSLNESFK